jgi:ATP phosphoribosyltransferase
LRFDRPSYRNVAYLCGVRRADIGIVGKDTLMEQGKDLYEPLDLKFATAAMILAGTG